MSSLRADPITRIKVILEELSSDGRGLVLLVVAGGWFLSLGVRQIYPALLPYLRSAFELDLTTAGLLITVLWMAYALGQFPAGVFSDRIGEGNILVVSTLISGVTVAIVAISFTGSVLFVATALFGFSTALFGVARFTLLTEIFEDRDGTAVGLTLAAGDAGNALLPPIAGVLATVFVWRVGFAMAVPLFALMAMAIWRTVPGRPSQLDPAVDSITAETAWYLLRGILKPTIVVVTVIMVLCVAIYQGFTGFYPTYLIEAKGLSPAVASGLFGLFFASGIVVKSSVGMANDRFGEMRTLLVVLAVITGSLAVLPFVGRLWLLVPLSMILSSILGYGVVTITYLTNELPSDIKGTGLGFIRSGYMFIGALNPILVGSLADSGYFDEAFLLMAGMGGIAFLLVFLVPADG